jgi:hypothetical protein
MPRRARTLASPVLILLALLLPLVPASAQVEGGAIGSEARSIGDEELRHFARLYLAVVQVRTTLLTDLEEAVDEAEARRLRERSRSEMHALVEASDLTVRRFAEIGHILDGDAEGRARLRAMVAEIRAEEGGGRPS